MAKLYGDMQGHQFRVWVDRISSAQIGSDIWLVKFHKWELSGMDWAMLSLVQSCNSPLYMKNSFILSMVELNADSDPNHN
uniref:Sucrose-phosphatase C-terminal domain-containing protein n=1 Tax=Quercus lobata TaxID=97700 RepID=A0A7N2LFW1_QUELO